MNGVLAGSFDLCVHVLINVVMFLIKLTLQIHYRFALECALAALVLFVSTGLLLVGEALLLKLVLKLVNLAFALLDDRESFPDLSLNVQLAHRLLLGAHLGAEFNVVGAESAANKIVLGAGANGTIAAGHTLEDRLVEG
jgi:uncharacterized membrane protein